METKYKFLIQKKRFVLKKILNHSLVLVNGVGATEFSEQLMEKEQEGKDVREVKFRGKSQVTGDWVTGTYIDGYIIRGVIEANSEYISIENWEAVHPESVGEYAGLKDKNDVEIYEGDIYHMGDTKITYTVIWQDTGLKGKQNGSTSYAGLLSWQERIEIIGNIYENRDFIN